MTRPTSHNRQRRVEQPAPPQHATTAPADPEQEPNPGDPGFPLLEPRAPEDLTDKIPNVAATDEQSGRGGAGLAAKKPGDQAPPGSPQSGANSCPRCSASGSIDGLPCVDCLGTGIVNTLMGDA
jgi:hypothetical protein